MKWVKHPRWGWLPDECPLFEVRWGSWRAAGSRPEEWELRIVGDMSDGALRMYDLSHKSCGYMASKEDSSAPYFPLTTAARDLLAALRAEVES